MRHSCHKETLKHKKSHGKTGKKEQSVYICKLKAQSIELALCLVPSLGVALLTGRPVQSVALPTIRNHFYRQLFFLSHSVAAGSEKVKGQKGEELQLASADTEEPY